MGLKTDFIGSVYRLFMKASRARQAALRAAPAELVALDTALDATAEEYAQCTDPARLLELDEAFHIGLCTLSGNPELVGMLRTIYDKIRFVRAADLRQLQAAGRTTIERHRAILTLVRAGGASAAAEAMRVHIEHRTRHATEAVRLAFADLYAPRDES